MATRKKTKLATDPLAPTPYNPRLEFTPSQLEAFQKSLKEFGDLSGICFNVRTGHLVGGNKRAAEFRERGRVEIYEVLSEVDSTGTVAWGWVYVDGTRFIYRRVDWTEDKEKLANIAANQHGAEFDNIKVADLFAGLPDGLDLAITGFDPIQIDGFKNLERKPEASIESARKTLMERFLVPPFSVLDARQGYWQDRKRAWLALGIKSEIGRGVNVLDMSATMAGITDETEREARNKGRRKHAEG